MNINFRIGSFRLTFVALFHLIPQDDPDKNFNVDKLKLLISYFLWLCSKMIFICAFYKNMTVLFLKECTKIKGM